MSSELSFDYDDDGQVFRCVFTVMRIESYSCSCYNKEERLATCRCETTHDVVTISSHQTKKEAMKVASEYRDCFVERVPLPQGYKLAKMSKEEEEKYYGIIEAQPDCEQGVQ